MILASCRYKTENEGLIYPLKMSSLESVGLSFFKRKTLLDGSPKPHDCKICRFQLKICGFLPGKLQKPQNLWILSQFKVGICKYRKVHRVLAKIHRFCGFCVAFEFKTRKVLISSVTIRTDYN